MVTSARWRNRRNAVSARNGNDAQLFRMAISFGELGPGSDLHEGIDVGNVLVRQHGVGIGRHVVGRIAHLALETVERQRGVGEDRRRAVIGAALARAAVAGEAAVSEEDALTVGGIALWGVLRRRNRGRTDAEGSHGEGRHRDTLERFHPILLSADRSRHRPRPGRRPSRRRWRGSAPAQGPSDR